jgi:hypothetical protein
LPLYEEFVRAVTKLPTLESLWLRYFLHENWLRHFRNSRCLKSVDWTYYAYDLAGLGENTRNLEDTLAKNLSRSQDVIPDVKFSCLDYDWEDYVLHPNVE